MITIKLSPSLNTQHDIIVKANTTKTEYHKTNLNLKPYLLQKSDVMIQAGASLTTHHETNLFAHSSLDTTFEHNIKSTPVINAEYNKYIKTKPIDVLGIIRIANLLIFDSYEKADNGYWFTTDSGSHIHVDDGESKEEALERFTIHKESSHPVITEKSYGGKYQITYCNSFSCPWYGKIVNLKRLDTKYKPE